MIPDDLLATSHEEIRQGNDSLEAILTRLPFESRVELEPLLRLALQVERLRDDTAAAPSASFRDQLRSQLMAAEVETELTVHHNGDIPSAPEFLPTPIPAPVTPLRQRGFGFAYRWQQLAAAFAAGVVMLGAAGLTGVQVTQAAKDSLPDQPLLYSLKLAQEQMQLTLAGNDQERVGIYLQITNSRLSELSRAADSGKTDLAFALSRKYEQSLAETTNAIQNQGPEKTAITRSEVAGVVAQQVSSLQDLAKSAPTDTRDAVAVALSAANRIAGDLPVQVKGNPAPSDANGPDATGTPLVTEPASPLPTATVTDAATSGSGLAAPSGDSAAAGVNRDQSAPAQTASSSFPQPVDKSQQPASAVTAPDSGKGLLGSVQPEPAPARPNDAATGPGPVPAQQGAPEPTTAPPVATPEAPAASTTSTPAPVLTDGSKPAVISTPPLTAPSTAPDAGKSGSGGLVPAPSPTPSKQVAPPATGGKNSIQPALRPSLDVDVSNPTAENAEAQARPASATAPAHSSEIRITGSMVAPDDPTAATAAPQPTQATSNP